MAQALDFSLRCNSLKCRTPLTERAVVTTCSFVDYFTSAVWYQANRLFQAYFLSLLR